MTKGENPSAAWPPRVVGTLVAVMLLGAGAFVVGVAGVAPLRAWQIYLVNYLFWSGVAVGGVVLVGIWHVSCSKWGKVFQGVAVAGAGFFPAVLVLFLPLILAGGTLFPWVQQTPEHRAAWMNPVFVFARDGLALLVLLVLAGAVAYFRVRPAAGARWEQMRGQGEAAQSPPAHLRGWRGPAAEQARSDQMLSRLSPILFIVYACVFSLLAFDLVQALDVQFYSTLFGGYFFFGSLYSGLAWLAVVSVLFLRGGAAQAALSPVYLHPFGKLLFGFCMFHGMLFFSQYLPIWYGNLPHEIEFVAVRSYEGFWPLVSWVFIIASLLLPFTILLSRKVKERPRSLAAVAGLVLVGMWLGSFVNVVPSLWHEHVFPFGLLELAITAGFAALMLLCFWGYSRYFPLLHYDPAHLPSSSH